jgi:hypothetical protein
LKFAYIPRETLAPWRRRRSTEEEKTMLVKTDNAPPSGELVLTDAEIEVFSQARAAGDNLRKNFDQWIAVGAAIQVAQRHADATVVGIKRRGLLRKKILIEQNLAWVAAKSQSSEIVRLMQVMRQLPAVEKWRSSLTEYERTRWSSPQSTFNRCPVFHSNGRKKAPAVKQRPMSVSELLKMPADDIALLLYRRSAPKMFAILRAMEELAATGSVVKPVSGWAAARERERPAAATVMAG